MHDLNDLYFFHTVVSCHGFAAAARQIGVPKSTLSKRVARLENRLQLRLLERTTRRLRTTDVGREFYEHCQTMLAGVEAAEAVAAHSRAEPQGMVRVSCPQPLMQGMMATLLPGFLKRYPKVRLQLKIFNRPADLIEDRLDIALRVRTQIVTDPALIVRPLGRSRFVLAMSPALLAACADPLTIERLPECPTLSLAEDADDDYWELVGPNGKTHAFRHQPRLLCSNFDMLRAAAIAGLGVALLPEQFVRSSVQSGELKHVLPDWHSPDLIIHAVFMSRKGMLPSVRALIDYLVSEVPKVSAVRN